MPAIPTGTITFLFTDVEGSTRLWEAHPRAMGVALARHDELLRQVIESHSGYVFKTLGDAFCAAFPAAPDALTAALAGQRALAAEDWASLGPGFAGLRVRMALHTGTCAPRDGDYFGPPVNRTARLMAAGHGGQILLSGSTRALVERHLPQASGLRDLGEHRLRDLQDPEHVWQVTARDLADITAPLLTEDDAHPRDRVLVSDAAVPRSLSESLADLMAAVRSDEARVTLSPEQLREVAEHRPSDLVGYRLARIAEWSLPRHRLDSRFVAMTLLIDRGEESMLGRWSARETAFADLGALMAEVVDPALVVLGPPGSGKSTLLRRFELDTAIAALRGDEATVPLTLFVPLGTYRAARPGEEPPAPGAWLRGWWAGRYPELHPLDHWIERGRVVFLLDALNEMPHQSATEYRARLAAWKDFVTAIVREHPGNRVVFSCRTLDYSAPLSTPVLRVPQVRIEPLGDDQVRRFLKAYSPVRGREIWQRLAGTPHLEIGRCPYFLKLLVELVDATNEIPSGRSGLFTGFVRHLLRREVERDHPLFTPGELLTERDVRRITQWRWHTPCELPERGLLIPRLAALAFAMQARPGATADSQVRAGYDEALELIDHPLSGEIVEAGVALSVLDEDPATDEVLFTHQLVQEYFAGRELARRPEPERLRTKWRADAVRPAVRDILGALAPAEPLPPLPSTGWEETAIMAVALCPEPQAFVRGLMEANLALAGCCAARPEVLGQLDEAFVHELRWALVGRCGDRAADMRARVAAGKALGLLGDPRLERHTGPDGAYLLPPLVRIRGGSYPIGLTEPYFAEVEQRTLDEECPGHAVSLRGFWLGRFPVTNAEWACFLGAGGYDDERWWVTGGEQAWRRGEITAEGLKANARYWTRRFREKPGLLEEYHRRGWGGISGDLYDLFRQRLLLTDEALEEHLSERYPGGRLTRPSLWRDRQFNNPAQPVVGVSWYEARAYCRWLAAQSGLAYRLATEVEWEAAARGRDGRPFAYGDTFDPLRANTYETHLHRPTPSGVFPDGATPEGVVDLTGNVAEWTLSLFGPDGNVPAFPYPYDPTDGREAPDAPPDHRRVARGGAWAYHREIARATCRSALLPALRLPGLGFRLALSDGNGG